jgi:hypothetical protein
VEVPPWHRGHRGAGPTFPLPARRARRPDAAARARVRVVQVCQQVVAHSARRGCAFPDLSPPTSPPDLSPHPTPECDRPGDVCVFFGGRRSGGPGWHGRQKFIARTRWTLARFSAEACLIGPLFSRLWRAAAASRGASRRPSTVCNPVGWGGGASNTGLVGFAHLLHWLPQLPCVELHFSEPQPGRLFAAAWPVLFSPTKVGPGSSCLAALFCRTALLVLLRDGRSAERQPIRWGPPRVCCLRCASRLAPEVLRSWRFVVWGLARTIPERVLAPREPRRVTCHCGPVHLNGRVVGWQCHHYWRSRQDVGVGSRTRPRFRWGAWSLRRDEMGVGWDGVTESQARHFLWTFVRQLAENKRVY